MIDTTKGVELGHERARQNLSMERGSWSFMWMAEKWTEDACEYARTKVGLPKNAPVSSAILRTLIPTPDLGIQVVDANVLCNAGIQRMLDLLIAAGGQALDSTHSRVGVSDTSGSPAAADTDLFGSAGSTHRQFKTMNATYPSRASQTVTWQSDFTSLEADFHWQDWGIDAGTANGTAVTAPLLNHKAEDLGTKTTGTWTLSGAVTIS